MYCVTKCASILMVCGLVSLAGCGESPGGAGDAGLSPTTNATRSPTRVLARETLRQESATVGPGIRFRLSGEEGVYDFTVRENMQESASDGVSFTAAVDASGEQLELGINGRGLSLRTGVGRVEVRVSADGVVVDNDGRPLSERDATQHLGAVVSRATTSAGRVGTVRLLEGVRTFLEETSDEGQRPDALDAGSSWRQEGFWSWVRRVGSYIWRGIRWLASRALSIIVDAVRTGTFFG